MSARVPTLEDVAAVCGVSTATVSRCLSAPQRVAPATRERILAAIDSLGYSPNFGARALASRRTGIVGAVVPTMSNAIFARGLQAFEEALAERGETLLMASSGYDAVTEERQIRSLVARGADGLLLIGRQRRPEVYRFLQQHGIPLVIAWSYSARSRHACVGFDNAAAMHALTDHALRLGHTRIAYLAGERRGNDRARDRVRGAARALTAAGLDAAAMPIVETAYDMDAAADAFEILMQARPRPTLVLCGNDVQAVAAIGRARALGLAVPGDVSITGFDDLEIATVVTPSLTTVRVPHRAMGEQAARVLLEGRDNGVQRIDLPAEPVLRDSLVAPRSVAGRALAPAPLER